MSEPTKIYKIRPSAPHTSKPAQPTHGADHPTPSQAEAPQRIYRAQTVGARYHDPVEAPDHRPYYDPQPAAPAPSGPQPSFAAGPAGYAQASLHQPHVPNTASSQTHGGHDHVARQAQRPTPRQAARPAPDVTLAASEENIFAAQTVQAVTTEQVQMMPDMLTEPEASSEGRRDPWMDAPQAQFQTEHTQQPEQNHQPFVKPKPMFRTVSDNSERGPSVPPDFGIEKEHPLFPIPFSVYIDGQSYAGESLSVTQMIVRAEGSVTLAPGTSHVGCVYLRYSNFGISIEPEITVLQARPDGQIVLQFADPTGDHLPQLRYLINSYIAGDVVSLNGMLSYTGPTAPKAPKPEKTAQETKAERIRSIGVLVASVLVALIAVAVVFTRYTTGHEMHPVFVDRDGQQMRATVGGQIGFLNPQAGPGEVAFAVNANSGDVLNFLMPCDCDIAWQSGMALGSTVLPSDLVATVYSDQDGITINTMMSVQGLSRAMRGDRLWLDFADGRSVQVTAEPSAATRAATLAGDMFLPVALQPVDPAALGADDLGQSARLRISLNLLDRFGFN